MQLLPADIGGGLRAARLPGGAPLRCHGQQVGAVISSEKNTAAKDLGVCKFHSDIPQCKGRDGTKTLQEWVQQPAGDTGA